MISAFRANADSQWRVKAAIAAAPRRNATIHAPGRAALDGRRCGCAPPGLVPAARRWFDRPVMGCLCCGAAPEVGALCRPCAREVAPCDGLIPDHLRTVLEPTGAEAWLVDGFGGAHAIGARCRIGRSHDGDLVVLTGSVSREHAELTRGDAGWTVRDLGSRNGTFVDGVRCQGRTPLRPRALLKVGDVALWFLAGVSHEPPRTPVMATAGAGGGLVRYQLVFGGAELCLVGGGDPAAGGAL